MNRTLGGTATSQAIAEQQAEWHGRKWEYKKEYDGERSGGGIAQYANLIGSQGWELVCADKDGWLWFKREALG